MITTVCVGAGLQGGLHRGPVAAFRGLEQVGLAEEEGGCGQYKQKDSTGWRQSDELAARAVHYSLCNAFWFTMPVPSTTVRI